MNKGLFILKWSSSGKRFGNDLFVCFFLNSFLVEAATDGHRTNHRAADEGSEPTADASLLLLWCLNWTTTQTPEPAVSRSASPGGLQC